MWQIPYYFRKTELTKSFDVENMKNGISYTPAFHGSSSLREKVQKNSSTVFEILTFIGLSMFAFSLPFDP